MDNKVVITIPDAETIIRFLEDDMEDRNLPAYKVNIYHRIIENLKEQLCQQ